MVVGLGGPTTFVVFLYYQLVTALDDCYVNKATQDDDSISIEIPETTINMNITDFYYSEWYRGSYENAQHNDKLAYFYC